MTNFDLPALARETAQQFARLENPDDPHLEAYGDLEALILAACEQALTAHTAQMPVHSSEIADDPAHFSGYWVRIVGDTVTRDDFKPCLSTLHADMREVARFITGWFPGYEMAIDWRTSGPRGDDPATNEVYLAATRVLDTLNGSTSVLQAGIQGFRAGAADAVVVRCACCFEHPPAEGCLESALKSNIARLEASLLQLQQEKDKEWLRAEEAEQARDDLRERRDAAFEQIEEVTKQRDTFAHFTDELTRTCNGYKARFTQLTPYLQHLRICTVWSCETCGHERWLHNKANDIDEETCDEFTPTTNCSCGLADLLPSPGGQP